MMRLPEDDKSLKIFSRFDTIHVRDGWTGGQTDGQTRHDRIGRAMHSVAQQKPFS